jgi:hypothetical protein
MMGFLALVPGLVIVVLFIVLWMTDFLPHPRVVGACGAIGLGLQFLGRSEVVSLAGLLINVVLAVYLVIRFKLS